MNNKQKIIIVSIAIVIAILLVGFLIIKRPKKSINFLQNIASTTEQIAEQATQGTLPSLTANPMENKPNLNPADKSNPIKDIKINPFD